jgi:hypothetical protein
VTSAPVRSTWASQTRRPPEHDRVDSAQAAATRRAFLAEWAADRALVIGTQFAGPTAGHVTVAADGDGDSWVLDV